jgi:hypothetical protein
MHRVRDRAKHGAAHKRCPDDSKLFHEILPSLQYGSQFTLIWNNVSDIKHQAEADLADLDLYQRWIVSGQFSRRKFMTSLPLSPMDYRLDRPSA